MYEFPANAFDATEQQRVPTIAAMDGLLAALPPNEHLIPAPGIDTADTEMVRSRNAIQVPYAYVSMVLTKRFKPREAWLEIAGAIRNDGREQALAPLLIWLRMACTASELDEEEEDDEQNNEFPDVSLGNHRDIFAPLDVDEDLQRHRWNTLCNDLPGLNPPPSPNDTDRVMALGEVGTL